MKIKRILSMTFALVMLLGMAAGMSQTAYAEGNTTEITPTKTSGTMAITLTIAYDVSITAGENMTKTTDSGAASQTGLSGAMTAVVYTADDGYYFPESYSVSAVNGISVTRDSYTQITVSGAPSADAAITLTAPTAKTKPDAPTTAAATDCTTADNNDGKLTGVTTAMEYKKSDAADWTAGADSDITDLAPGTYYVRVKATDTTLASDNQELTIKGFISYTVTFKVVNGSWNDEALTGEQTVTLTGHEGDTLKLAENQIPAVGGKPAANYKAGSWDTEPSTETAITTATTYTYTYAAKDAISQTVTFKVVNGSWDDGNSADITVTLSGHEGDTLKLSENQIPAVGTKPADTFKAGAWDVVPSIETAITAATTYTYTYAQIGAATVATPPTAKTLTYNGQAQELVTAGSASGGEMYYELGTDAVNAPSGMGGDTSIPTATDAGTYYVWYKVVGDANHADTEAACVIVTIGEAEAEKLYYTESGEGQNHMIESGEDATFTVKRSAADDTTFSRFTGIQVDGKDVDEGNYDKSAGSVIIKLKAAYLDTLSVGSHILKVLFTDGSVELPFTVSAASAPVVVEPTGFEAVATPSKTFTFKKVWEGGSEKSIDFTLYKLGDTVYHHGFDKKIISKTEWQYNAWFSEAVACYVIEEPVEGYKTRYENVGVYAGITDRCCDGGTIVNYRVPKTGDNANLMLWLGCALAGLALISASVYAGKRKKAHSK